jgi:hypothetical protein
MYDGWEAARSTDFKKSTGISSTNKRIDGFRRGFCPDHGPLGTEVSAIPTGAMSIYLREALESTYQVKPIEVEWSMSVKFSRRDTNKLIIGFPAFVLGFKFSHSLMSVDENKIIAMDSEIGQQQIERTPL